MWQQMWISRNYEILKRMENLGGYVLVDRLGSGGMGQVWEAIDADGCHVALKLLHPHVARDPESRRRLEREVALLQRVRSPRVARIMDAELDDVEAFLVTELVDGTTLDHQIAENGPLSREELALLARELTEALEEIHAVGVIHRDVKPSNVMMSSRGAVLIDFGIAQVTADPRITHTGMVTGTAGYVDPLIMEGGEPSMSSDWWSWAAVLAFAATGRHPFGEGGAPAVIARVTRGDVDLEGAPVDLVEAFRSALSPDPDRRIRPGLLLRLIEHESPHAAHPLMPQESVTEVLGGDGTPPTESVSALPPDNTTVLDPSDNTAVFGTSENTAVLDAGAQTAVLGVADFDDVARLSVDANDGHTRQLDVVQPSPPQPYPGEFEYPTEQFAPPANPAYAEPAQHPSTLPVSPPYVAQQAPYGAQQDIWGTPMPLDGAGYPDSDANLHAPLPEWLTPPPRASGTVVSLWMLAIALASMRPGIAALAAFGVVLLFAVAGIATTRRREVRLEKGVRPWDGLRAGLALPVHTVAGTLLTVYLVAGAVAVGWSVWQLSHTYLPSLVGRQRLIIMAMIGAGALVAWWLPGAGQARVGARVIVRFIAPSKTARIVLVLLVLLASVLLVAVAFVANVAVLWWPFPQDLGTIPGLLGITL